MRLLIGLIIFSSPILVFADSDDPVPFGKTYAKYSVDDAFNITTEAVMKLEQVKLLMKNSEEWAWKEMRYIGLKEEVVNPVATIVAPIVFRKISTRGLHFHWEPVKDLTLRPDVDYHLDSTEFEGAFVMNWSF